MKDETSDICYGHHPVMALIDEAPERCHKILVSESINKKLFDEIYNKARRYSIPISKVKPQALDRITDGASHQGIVAYVVKGKTGDMGKLLDMVSKANDKALVIMADKIKDPHNLGAIIRSAEVFGALGVIIPKRNSAFPNSTVHKTSAGASLRIMTVTVSNLVNSINELKEKGVWIVGLDQRAERHLWDKPPIGGKLAFVVGSEEMGISQVVAKACDDLRSIPMLGKTGSLNAAVAASIGMYEWARCCSEMIS